MQIILIRPTGFFVRLALWRYLLYDVCRPPCHVEACMTASYIYISLESMCLYPFAIPLSMYFISFFSLHFWLPLRVNGSPDVFCCGKFITLFVVASGSPDVFVVCVFVVASWLHVFAVANGSLDGFVVTSWLHVFAVASGLPDVFVVASWLHVFVVASGLTDVFIVTSWLHVFAVASGLPDVFVVASWLHVFAVASVFTSSVWWRTLNRWTSIEQSQGETEDINSRIVFISKCHDVTELICGCLKMFLFFLSVSSSLPCCWLNHRLVSLTRQFSL